MKITKNGHFWTFWRFWGHLRMCTLYCKKIHLSYICVAKLHRFEGPHQYSISSPKVKLPRKIKELFRAFFQVEKWMKKVKNTWKLFWIFSKTAKRGWEEKTKFFCVSKIKFLMKNREKSCKKLKIHSHRSIAPYLEKTAPWEWWENDENDFLWDFCQKWNFSVFFRKFTTGA